ncbi:hypothetical protein RHMOL_Rhmol12G0058500 [Rhododendron molle]|uniref:Uncharacterized protein n=1 Tax=Rhododendron molle TaxID=49168 RepID=A0ACC0LFW0_RHOML|nr:hypothetical protein RHMOL_Rhmol12G0058500 [Rhododendron molle]
MGLWREYSYSGAKKEGEVILQTEPFQKMVRLRLLQLSNVRLEGNFKCIPPELKWLQWRKCPLENLPSDFCPQQLAVLDLSDSKIENVWGLRWWSWCKNKGCSNLVDFPHDVSGLKHLETLILSGCSKLTELPLNMDCLSFLRKLLVDNTAIERLPESLVRLSKLEVLSLDECQSLKWLPPCIGQLDSLRDLSLNGLPLEELPDSIGCLVNLETLSLMRCKSLTVIPCSVGNLRMLARFWLNGRSVMELPASIGSLSYLKYFSVGNCSSLTKLPVSIGRLASLVELHLDGTSIIDLPVEVDGLKSLERLEMRNCKSLRSLPDSIGHLVTLTRLIILNASIVELPESTGMLKNLTMLTLDYCAKLCRLPSSIGYLNFLHHLYMEETSVIELPESFGMLSRLMILKMGKNPYREVSEDAETTEIANKPIVLPSSFSILSVLEEFDARAWKISGKIPDDFEKLSCLETLKLGHNDFHSLPCNLRGLSILKKLFLPHCENLLVLPPLPSSLLELNAESYTALETLSDLSNLENLNDLNLANCVKLKGIPGLKCLKSLRRSSKNGEDHFYLCRYPDFRPLVLCLQEGDKIQVARRNPPVVEGVQLKKCGIHLLFEHDDNYDGDEKWLHESQQSVSQKLATFVGSEEDTRIRDNISENDGETEGRKQSKRLLSSNHRNYFVLLLIALPSAFLLLSWLVFMFFTWCFSFSLAVSANFQVPPWDGS